MAIPRKGVDQTDERRIVLLVTEVRETRSENAFNELHKYLRAYIDLFQRRYRIPGCDCDEIEQECLFALRFKAIEDFNPKRGKFRSFAILCMRRHLFSIIKASTQQKRKVLNESLSLDEDRSEGDELSLNSLVTNNKNARAEQPLERDEINQTTKEKLLCKLSRLEQEVFNLYIQQHPYEEIAEELEKIFPKKKFSKKSVDNALVRVRGKSRTINITDEIF